MKWLIIMALLTGCQTEQVDEENYCETYQQYGVDIPSACTTNEGNYYVQDH